MGGAFDMMMFGAVKKKASIPGGLSSEMSFKGTFLKG
jgi:hypothetical protein